MASPEQNWGRFDDKRSGTPATRLTDRPNADPHSNDSGQLSAVAFSPRAFRRSLRRAGITLTQYRVAVELCEYARQDRSVVWPSIAVLAEDCELDRSTVIRNLNRLEVKGFFACDGARKGGRGQSTT